MAQLNPAKIGLTATTVAMAAAAAGGDKFKNDGKTTFRITAGATGATVTIASQKPCSHGVVHNLPITVAPSSTVEVGPFDPARFNDVNGDIVITYSQVATITVAAISRGY